MKTAESVRAGHPDKLCDYIADCILDRALYEDPAARVAVEVMAIKARIYVAGEITCKAKLEIPMLVRAALEHVGYEASWVLFRFLYGCRNFGT
ncbi:S-adenosylmethionine synthetase N-terminal domain-containing protein, partial [Trueperella bernardiae]|uniref:S-adenosylmethionine synthetase N-terminal domain-containing protein n=1 Tax=Trueperella bernardiae TaxID=59561 RepID=UPI00374F9097